MSDNSKVVWIVSVNVWSGRVLNAQVRIIDSNFSIGSTSNGNGTVNVCVNPIKEDADACGNDKQKVFDAIRNSLYYKSCLLEYTFTNTLVF